MGETATLPLISTRLYRPRVAGDLVSRPVLLERLDWRRKQPLTLVLAQVGYGKTILVSSSVETAGCPSAWLSLDEDDDDLASFLTQLIGRHPDHLPRCLRRLAGDTPDGYPVPDPPLGRTLINELDQIKESFIPVLDDYRRVRNRKEQPALEVDGSRLRCSIKPCQCLTLRLLARAT